MCLNCVKNHSAGHIWHTLSTPVLEFCFCRFANKNFLITHSWHFEKSSEYQSFTTNDVTTFLSTAKMFQKFISLFYLYFYVLNILLRRSSETSVDRISMLRIIDFASSLTFFLLLFYPDVFILDNWQAAKKKIFCHATSNLCLQEIFQHVLAVYRPGLRVPKALGTL